MIVYRLSNHPDLVGLLPILFENPESRPICDGIRTITILKSVLINIKYTGAPNRVYLIETDTQKT